MYVYIYIYIHIPAAGHGGILRAACWHRDKQSDQGHETGSFFQFRVGHDSTVEGAGRRDSGVYMWKKKFKNIYMVHDSAVEEKCFCDLCTCGKEI